MGRGCDLRESQGREKTNPTGNQTPTTRDREGFREDGEGETGGSHGREKTNPTKGTRPPLTTDREGFREGDLWIQMNWRGELVVRVGFGD